jgi:thymidylate kinase
MKLIVLEGTDGSGKSHHTDALAARLHAAGIAAESYHHPPAPTRDPYRAELVARCEAFATTLDDLARRAKEARASVTRDHDATVSESSATRIARATQARSIPRKENA